MAPLTLFIIVISISISIIHFFPSLGPPTWYAALIHCPSSEDGSAWLKGVASDRSLRVAQQCFRLQARSSHVTTNAWLGSGHTFPLFRDRTPRSSKPFEEGPDHDHGPRARGIFLFLAPA